jgi:hypothetical protein
MDGWGFIGFSLPVLFLMTELLPIIRRKRQPLNNAGAPDAGVQLRAKCAVLEADCEALRAENARLVAELASRKPINHSK